MKWLNRCDWATKDLLSQEYHDQEWGKPLHDEDKLFEMLVLESMQAGLSWITILKKRETMRQAFDQFNYREIAFYQEADVDRLIKNPGIIRHRKKIEALINNAEVYLAIQKKYGSFNDYLWRMAGYTIINNHWQAISEVPASTELSDRISKQFKKDGFKFLGATSVYAFLQSVGIVNDHLEHCPFK